jgi:anti-sigma B factor antagonist
LHDTEDGDTRFRRRDHSALCWAPLFGDEAAGFRDRIKNILFGTRQIVVNLSGIEYIDSGGLGTLVGLLASTRNRQGEIKLVHPIQRVVDLLQRTRLHTVFKSYESDDEAVAAFRDPELTC